MSKGYTLSFFINTLNNVTNTQVSNKGLYNTISPRDGVFSVKADALDTWLDLQTSDIVAGRGRFQSYGKSARTRVLKALRNRKAKGTV